MNDRIHIFASKMSLCVCVTSTLKLHQEKSVEEGA